MMCPVKRYPGPCSVCGEARPGGYYTKTMCKTCYGRTQRRAQGITGSRPKLWEGPCIACGRMAPKFKKKMCDTCYKRIVINRGSPTRRAKYNGPCLACGVKEATLNYSRKLCPTCFNRALRGHKPRKAKYNGPCLECGSTTSTSGRFYTKLCRTCYDRKGDRHRLSQARKKARFANAESTLTDEQWRRVLEHFDYRCAYCDKDIRDFYTMDHVVPFSKGGENIISNVVPCCVSCNSRKSDGPPLRPVITLKE